MMLLGFLKGLIKKADLCSQLYKLGRSRALVRRSRALVRYRWQRNNVISKISILLVQAKIKEVKLIYYYHTYIIASTYLLIYSGNPLVLPNFKKKMKNFRSQNWCRVKYLYL